MTKKKKIQNFEEYEKYTLSAAEDYNKKDYEKALEKFLDMAEYNRDNYKLHETLSLIYLKLNRLEEAENEYKIAVELIRKKNIDLAMPRPLEEVVQELDNLEMLENEYNSLDEEAGKSTRLPIQMGIHYIARGEYEKALQFLTEHKEKYFVARK